MQNRIHLEKSVRGFSLVELLVVIAIVGMLLAMLLPAISEARANARKVVCLSQVRQQSVAIFTYCSDQKDTAFPFARRFSASWMIRLSPYMGWSGVSQVDESTGNSMDGKLGDRSDSAVRVDRKVPGWICPEANFRREPSPTYNSGYYGINLDLTSSVAGVSTSSSWAARRTLQQIRYAPSRIVLAGEAVRYAEIEYFTVLSNSTNVGAANERGHRQALNELFVDGHSESLKRYTRTDLLATDLKPGDAPSSYYQPGWY